MELRPYDSIGADREKGPEAPVADMAALNAPTPEDAIAAEADLARERGERLDAYTRALSAHTETVRSLERRVGALAEELSNQRAEEVATMESAVKSVDELRSEVASLCGDAADRALEVGEQVARRHFSWMSGAIRDQDSALAEAARHASAAIEGAADRCVTRVNAASASAASAIDKSKVEVGKVMGEMRRQYLAKPVIVPATVAVLVIYLTLLTWRIWPIVTGSTMTDLDAANLRIEQLSTELDAYKSTGVALGDERQRALDERLAELREAYDASHGADAPAEG